MMSLSEGFREPLINSAHCFERLIFRSAVLLDLEIALLFLRFCSLQTAKSSRQFSISYLISTSLVVLLLDVCVDPVDRTADQRALPQAVCNTGDKHGEHDERDKLDKAGN